MRAFDQFLLLEKLSNRSQTHPSGEKEYKNVTIHTNV